MLFDLAKIAERLIEEAIEEGKFDNLPGRGQPFDPEVFETPVHIRLLKNAGVTPDWMQIEQEIDRNRAECARMWALLLTQYPRRRERAEHPTRPGLDPAVARQNFNRWLLQARKEYLRTLKQVNLDILRRNLTGPTTRRVLIPYRIEEETARFDSTFVPFPGVEAPEQAAEERQEGTLRAYAHVIYQIDREKARGV